MTVMWHDRLRIRVARPRARGLNRFSVEPSSAYAEVMKSSSGACPSLFAAFATAEARTLVTTAAASRGVAARISWARSTSLPRTRSSTCRALEADMR